MIKKSILIIAFLTFSLNYGQYDWTPGKIALKNGDTLKGLLKIPRITRGLLSIPKSKIEYKKDRKEKKKKFHKTQVDKIFFRNSKTNLGYYEYIPISNILNKKIILLKLIRNGKVKLYTRTIKVGINIGFPGNNDSFQQKKIENRKEYYIIRKNEKLATHIPQESGEFSITYKGSLRSFKNYMKKYFSDCPDILTYIDDDLYKDFDIRQIVDDYNLFCE